MTSIQYLVYILQCNFWEKLSSMASADKNLIDFSGDHHENTKQSKTMSIPILTGSNVATTTGVSVLTPTAVTTPKAGGKTSNKSLFEITRVESHGSSVGGDDSELDDTLSETHDSSSTSVLDSIAKFPETDNIIVSTVPSNSSKPLTVSVSAETTLTTSSSSSTSSTPVSNSQSAQQTSEAPSRFRIVKIAKSKPYDKGKWAVDDYSDSQKQQNESTENPNASPVVKRTRQTTESSGDNKHDRNKSVTSPTEPVKTKSSEFLMQQSLPLQSRGSSYNISGVDRRSSNDGTTASDASSPIVIPMVEALETALDQIQSIKQSMVNAVNDEVRKLKESLVVMQGENYQLREENEKLRKKLDAAEERLHSLDKG